MVSYQIIRPVKLPYVSACQLLPKNKTEKIKNKMRMSPMMQNHFRLPELSYTWHDLFAFLKTLHNSHLNTCKCDSLNTIGYRN